MTDRFILIDLAEYLDQSDPGSISRLDAKVIRHTVKSLQLICERIETGGEPFSDWESAAKDMAKIAKDALNYDPRNIHRE